MSAELSCHEAARYVYAYLDGEIEPRTSAEFLRHLEACRRCVGVVDFERRVIDFVRARGTAESAPAELLDRVRRVFETADGTPTSPE